MERARGIEPPYEAWEAPILPLNYARPFKVIYWLNFTSFDQKKSTEINNSKNGS